MSATRTADRADAFRRRLPPQPSSVAEARDLVRDLLAEVDQDELVEAAVLLVSEIVTNALLHAGTPIDVSATFDTDGLRVEVADGSVHLPVRRNYALTSGTGRGLRLLEQMVDDWGVSRSREGKTVWFRLTVDHDDAHVDPVVDGGGTARSAADTVEVELGGMPLLLHAAWQEHAEALLREYLLASLDGDADGSWDPIQVHAEATDAIALLEEHVPHPDFDLTPERLMDDVTEPRVSAAAVRVPVPRGSVAHFETLNQAIEAAIALSRQGIVMTPPTQPEIQQFRRWVCTQVAAQARGAAPTPWHADADAQPYPAGPLHWDTGTVLSSPTPRLAADEANRIVAVSPAALELLGYDEPSGLVGHRVVSIIPDRFRQAHVAGFTMYLLVGRRPLLDKPVVVPVLRADGSEALVELLVTTEPTGDGREVFLADLQPVEEK